MQYIPQADLNEFLSEDPVRKEAFVQHIGTAFQEIGFLALKGHLLDAALQEKLYQEIRNFFELPRSAPLVGGIVLSLMTLPTIIITSRAAIQAVSPSIREAALGVGASKLQTVFHHVLPVAMPGILTGSIIGMAQALGESAPLLMIGMVAFIMDVPGGVTDSSTVLPVQIYLWADSPERGFTEKTSAAIMVLMGFLILMNALAIILRKRFELK